MGKTTLLKSTMNTVKSSNGNLTIKARTLPGAATFAMARQGIA